MGNAESTLQNANGIRPITPGSNSDNSEIARYMFAANSKLVKRWVKCVPADADPPGEDLPLDPDELRFRLLEHAADLRQKAPDVMALIDSSLKNSAESTQQSKPLGVASTAHGPADLRDKEHAAIARARAVFQRAQERMISENFKKDRAQLLVAWRNFEAVHGGPEEQEKIDKQMPRKVKKRRNPENGSSEYYIDYIFPADDHSQTQNTTQISKHHGCDQVAASSSPHPSRPPQPQSQHRQHPQTTDRPTKRKSDPLTPKPRPAKLRKPSASGLAPALNTNDDQDENGDSGLTAAKEHYMRKTAAALREQIQSRGLGARTRGSKAVLADVLATDDTKRGARHSAAPDALRRKHVSSKKHTNAPTTMPTISLDGGSKETPVVFDAGP